MEQQNKAIYCKHIVCWTSIERTRQGSTKSVQKFQTFEDREKAEKAFEDLVKATADNGVENVYVARVLESMGNGDD